MGELVKIIGFGHNRNFILLLQKTKFFSAEKKL